MSEQTGSRTPLVKIYGRLGSAEAYRLRDFLHRCDVPFEWIPLESDAQARLPVCEFPDGTRMESPTIRQVIGKLGCYLEDGTRIVARASICATGIEYRRLGLPEAERFLGAGVYYGAGASEAALTKGEDVYIVGGGNSAGQAAMHLAGFAKRIFIVIRD